MEGVCRFFGSVITMGRNARPCGPQGSEPVTLEKVTELAPAESVITMGRVLPEPVE
jgi:hypothetical protein